MNAYYLLNAELAISVKAKQDKKLLDVLTEGSTSQRLPIKRRVKAGIRSIWLLLWHGSLDLRQL